MVKEESPLEDRCLGEDKSALFQLKTAFNGSFLGLCHLSQKDTNAKAAEYTKTHHCPHLNEALFTFPANTNNFYCKCTYVQPKTEENVEPEKPLAKN